MELGLPKSVQLHLAAKMQPPLILCPLEIPVPKTTLDPPPRRSEARPAISL